MLAYFTILSSQGFGILREILTSSDIVGVANKETCVLCVLYMCVLCVRTLCTRISIFNQND